MEHRLLHRFPKHEKPTDDCGGRISTMVAVPNAKNMPVQMIEETEADIAAKLRQRMNNDTQPSQN